MDVDEFFSTFMDKLETELGQEHKHLISGVFGGRLAHVVCCKECG